MIYSLLYKFDEFNMFKSNWLSPIRCTLNDSGFPGIWLAQSLPCSVQVSESQSVDWMGMPWEHPARSVGSECSKSSTKITNKIINHGSNTYICVKNPTDTRYVVACTVTSNKWLFAVGLCPHLPKICCCHATH